MYGFTFQGVGGGGKKKIRYRQHIWDLGDIPKSELKKGPFLVDCNLYKEIKINKKNGVSCVCDVCG